MVHLPQTSFPSLFFAFLGFPLLSTNQANQYLYCCWGPRRPAKQNGIDTKTGLRTATCIRAVQADLDLHLSPGRRGDLLPAVGPAAARLQAVARSRRGGKYLDSFACSNHLICLGLLYIFRVGFTGNRSLLDIFIYFSQGAQANGSNRTLGETLWQLGSLDQPVEPIFPDRAESSRRKTGLFFPAPLGHLSRASLGL